MNIDRAELPKPDYKARIQLATKAVEKVAGGKDIQTVVKELQKEYGTTFLQRIEITAQDVWQAIKDKKESVDNLLLLIRVLRVIWQLKKTGEIDETLIHKIIKGDSTAGKIIFGILDVAPVPNFHEISKSVWKNHPEMPFFDKLKLVFKKVDWKRTIVALVTAAATAAAAIAGSM